MECCCRGGFCELVLPNDNSLPINSNNGASNLPNKVGASLSKRERRLQNSRERERIIGLLKWVLTKEEYCQLEETGDLVRLRANKSQGDTTTSNNKNQGFWIDGESINLARKEHRPNLARLAFAEFQSSSSSDHTSNAEGNSESNATIAVPSSTRNEGDEAVCGICFNVYTLLNQSRKLLLASQDTDDRDEAMTTLDVGHEVSDNPPAKQAGNRVLIGKEEASANKQVIKPSSKGPIRSSSQRNAATSKEPPSSRAPPDQGSTSPQHKSGDNDNLKSKRKEKQRKRDKDKLEKNSKIHILVAESDEV